MAIEEDKKENVCRFNTYSSLSDCGTKKRRWKSDMKGC